ncbi:response regulator receiver modulated diguanylate cyclase/phosphodiesterase [Nitrosomonas eutropha]|uniref:Response regulator receiver modulated diguanylate cyclase/phosphodiesterase n=1 Tax=Nitrosomonas eutropha TaxID=916 RepID=A0A1I7IXT1_9PROT|nr:EAL domain-containing protein [Nitrosomonas eutropha]SFU77708.1 response regulator receiver modulated diguanylate cyclase/phosphodiesterase [Nitrosomonas eutropha]
MSYGKLKLLIVGHSEADVNQLSADFSRSGKQLIYQHANSLPDVRSALDTSSWDAVIAEYSMAGFDALQVLDLLKIRHQATPFILYTSITDEQVVLSALRNGASDCVPKGHSTRLILAINRGFELMDLKRRKRQADSHIYRMTYYDELTGLPKHNLFCEKAAALLSNNAVIDGMIAAVYFIDINRLSRINSKYGYSISDQLIQQFASRLSIYSDNSCVLARTEGGNFVFLKTSLASTNQVQIFANQLLKLVTTPFVINDLEFHITLTIGICLYPRDGREIEVLLANAENALSFTRKTWPNTYRFYAREIGEASLQKVKIEQSLQQIINDKELVLHYQPVIDLITGKIIGVEALVRWCHPELGLLPPDKFVPLAVESGSIVKIGKWVLHEACRQAKSWQDAGLEPAFIAVNLSAIELDQLQLINHVAEALHATGLDPSKLELEINESVLMQDIDGSTRILNELKRMGVKIVMDNFGTGYSSLNHLRRLPIDTIKIGQSLVQDIASKSDSSVIITAIIALARNLGMQIRAEGVQSQAQLDFLKQANCHHVQGFLLTPPVSAEHFLPLIEQRKTGTFS